MLSELVIELLKKSFPQEEQAQAQALLAFNCSGSLPMTEHDLNLIERIQVGVIKLSCGNLNSLREWVSEAHADWRDVLDAAGFYSDSKAHLTWKP